MSTTSFQELHEGRDGGDMLDAKRMSETTRVRRFRAINNSVYDGPDAVLTYMNKNKLVTGTKHPTFKQAVMEKRTVKATKSKVVFDITLDYKTLTINGGESGKGGSAGPNPDPLFDFPDISWGTASTSKRFMYDKDGKPIINSAGAFFETGTEAEDGYWTCTVKKNVPTLLNNNFFSYRKAINTDAFTLDSIKIKPYCAFMQQIGISPWQMRNDQFYRVLTMVIGIRSGDQLRGIVGGPTSWGLDCGPIRDDWLMYLYDEGLTQIQNFNATLPSFEKGIPIFRLDGSIATRPMALNGKGNLLDPVTPDTAVFLPYHIRLEKPFAPLQKYFN
jgi:hypothetical protein